MPPSAELRKRLQDGISRVQKVAAVEIGLRGASGCLGGTWIYIGGRSRSVEQQGAHEGGGRAQGVSQVFLDAHSKFPGSCLLRKSHSRRFHSVWTPFDISFPQNTAIGKKTAIRAGPPVSRLVPKMI